MLIRLIAVGHKMPEWVTAGFQEYAKRLPAHFALKLVEIPAEKRSKNSDISQLVTREGEKILAAIHPNERVIALDVKGNSFSTEKLSTELNDWLQQGRDTAILIGGPDGLSSACLQKAEQKWSLSALTLPHPLVRIVIAEQLYRAFSILQRHPYHRSSPPS